MSYPNSRGVNTAVGYDKTSSLNRQVTTDVNNTGNNPDTPVTSKELARQVRAVTDPLSKQLELLCDCWRIYDKAL